MHRANIIQFLSTIMKKKPLKILKTRSDEGYIIFAAILAVIVVISMTKYQKKVGELESSVENLMQLGAEMNELKKLFLNQNYTRNEYSTHDIQKNTILTTEHTYDSNEMLNFWLGQSVLRVDSGLLKPEEPISGCLKM